MPLARCLLDRACFIIRDQTQFSRQSQPTGATSVPVTKRTTRASNGANRNRPRPSGRIRLRRPVPEFGDWGIRRFCAYIVLRASPLSARRSAERRTPSMLHNPARDPRPVSSIPVYRPGINSAVRQRSPATCRSHCRLLFRLCLPAAAFAVMATLGASLLVPLPEPRTIASHRPASLLRRRAVAVTPR